MMSRDSDTSFVAAMGANGRIVIPAAVRSSMGLREGSRIRMRLVDGELRLTSPEMTLGRLQQWAREALPAGTSLVEELLQERRHEAGGE